MMKKIVIATKNKGKAKEFKTFFRKYNLKALSLLDLPEDIPDVAETGSTFEENAAIKAETISALLQQTVISDDSGLMVDALDGEPGIYSARYAGEDKNDGNNMKKLLKKLDQKTEAPRTARFVCVLAISTPGKPTVFYKGYCEGSIAEKPAGTYGFGYDPIFIPKGYSKTMAELAPDEKNQISHRRHAFDQLEEWAKSFQKEG